MKEDYDDIINLPHHISTKQPHMPMEKRAAQFAPFAALGEESLHRSEENNWDSDIDINE